MRVCRLGWPGSLVASVSMHVCQTVNFLIPHSSIPFPLTLNPPPPPPFLLSPTSSLSRPLPPSFLLRKGKGGLYLFLPSLPISISSPLCILQPPSFDLILMHQITHTYISADTILHLLSIQLQNSCIITAAKQMPYTRTNPPHVRPATHQQ